MTNLPKRVPGLALANELEEAYQTPEFQDYVLNFIRTMDADDIQHMHESEVQ